MIIVRTGIVITIVTIVVDYFAQLHDPIVYLLATRSLDLIVLEASVVVALWNASSVKRLIFYLPLISTYTSLYLLSARALRRRCDYFCRCRMLNWFLYFGDCARIGLAGVLYQNDRVCVLVEFWDADEAINGSRFLRLCCDELRGHSLKKSERWAQASRKLIKYLLVLVLKDKLFSFCMCRNLKLIILVQFGERMNEIRNHSWW